MLILQKPGSPVRRDIGGGVVARYRALDTSSALRMMEIIDEWRREEGQAEFLRFARRFLSECLEGLEGEVRVDGDEDALGTIGRDSEGLIPDDIFSILIPLAQPLWAAAEKLLILDESDLKN